MASAPNLDDFGGGLNNVQEEVCQKLALIQDLDKKYQKVMADIDKMSDDYILNMKKYSARKQEGIMACIEAKYAAAKKIADEKFEISKENFASVDNVIQNIDVIVSKFEKQVKLKADTHETPLKAKRYLKPKKGGSKKKSAPPTASAVTDPSKPTNSVDNVAVETRCPKGASVGPGIEQSASADMPIDLNEPKYCLCDQVEFGKMVACDNPDCVIEWFHFTCVGVIAKPKGKWICPNCKKNQKKK